MAKECPKCQHENPDDTIFCGKCGTLFHFPRKAVVTEIIVTHKEELTADLTSAGRSQIIEQLEKGAEGEVYRAENAKMAE